MMGWLCGGGWHRAGRGSSAPGLGLADWAASFLACRAATKGLTAEALPGTCVNPWWVALQPNTCFLIV